MILRNMPIVQLLYRIPIRIILDSIFIIKTLLSGQVKAALANGKGILVGLSKIPSIKKEKRNTNFYIQRYGKEKTPTKSYRLGVLPISYYLMNRKTFKQLKSHE